MTALLVKRARRQPMHAVAHVDALRHEGLAGDCHARPLGPRQALVVRQEDLDALRLTARQVRANVAVRGLDAGAVASGDVLAVGDRARIRITHRCETCRVLREHVPAEAFGRLPARRGWLGVVLAGGPIMVGDRVLVEAAAYPSVPDGLYDRLAWVVERIPRGCVTTYDTLLELVGASKPFFRVLPAYLKRAHAVGLPAHRVLTSARRVTGHIEGQATILAVEGVRVNRALALVGIDRLWDAGELYRQR